MPILPKPISRFNAVYTIMLFFEGANWYKGNIHTHTVFSQSKLVDLYQERGYDFLALTDHRVVTNTSAFDDDNFIVIPGIEIDTNSTSRVYHCLGLAGSVSDGERIEPMEWKGLDTVQAMIDDLGRRGMATVLCHPIWSRLELADFLPLQGYFALEIFNHACAVKNRTGLCVDYWDSLLRRNRRIWGVATDDTHRREHCFGGWVMVQSPSLTKSNIIRSLLQGRFYSSNGPQIHEFTVRNKVAHVKCSPVNEIHFVTYETRGASVIRRKFKLTSADHKLGGNEKYVRVECVDWRGRTAWSNPIFL